MTLLPECYVLFDDCMYNCISNILSLRLKLERVQRRATRLISEISQLSYEERLQQCRLTTLETRRIRGDQIEVFKIMHGYEGLNKDVFQNKE